MASADTHEHRHRGRDPRRPLRLGPLGQRRHGELAPDVERGDPRRPRERQRRAARGGQPGVAPGDPHLDLGLADLEPVAALEHRAVDLLSLHLDAVGRAEVDDLEDVGDEQPGVPARDLHVAQLDLAAATTTEVCRARTERDLPAGVGAGHDDGRRDGLAAVGIPLGAAGDRDVRAGAQAALGDGGARVDGAVALGHVGQGEVAQPGLERRPTPARGVGEDEVLRELPDGGGAVDGGDEVGVDVAGGSQGELQLHEAAVLRVRVASDGQGAVGPGR